jgi:hypothetical protein
MKKRAKVRPGVPGQRRGGFGSEFDLSRMLGMIPNPRKAWTISERCRSADNAAGRPCQWAAVLEFRISSILPPNSCHTKSRNDLDDCAAVPPRSGAAPGPVGCARDGRSGPGAAASQWPRSLTLRLDRKNTNRPNRFQNRYEGRAESGSVEDEGLRSFRLDGGRLGFGEGPWVAF